MTQHGLSTLERFMLYVHAEPNTGCWLWAGADDGRHGYGRFRHHGLGTPQAHRVSYILHKGPVPDGLTLDHKCRQRACVNPDHLEPVTRIENIRRGAYRKGLALGGHANGQRQRGRTHCKRGHELNAANTRHCITAAGTPGRQCKRCHAIRERERQASRRAGGL